MKNLLDRILTLLLLLNVAAKSYAADIGGGEILTVPVSVKANGMGGSFVAVADNASAVFWNPAGMIHIQKKDISITQNKYITGINEASLIFSYPTKYVVLTGAYLNFFTPSEDILDENGALTGNSFSYRTDVPLLSIAGKQWKRISWGVTGKWFKEKISDFSQTTLSGDVGGLYSGRYLNFGLSVQNIGKINNLLLPIIYRTGLAWKVRSLVFSGEYNAYSSVGQKYKNSANFGMQYTLMESISLRWGYRALDDLTKWTVGLGLKYGRSSLDYAFVPYGALGNSHQVALHFQFGKPVGVTSVHIEQTTVGGTPAENGKFNLAVLDFDAKNVAAQDSSIVSDLLRSEIVNTHSFNVVERQNMEKILKEHYIQLTGCTATECAVKIGRLLNAQKIVMGSVSKLEGTYFVTGNMVDVESGKIELSVTEEASNPKFLRDAAESLANRFSKAVR